MEMFPACHAQLSWKKTSPRSHYIPPVREHKLWGKSKQSMFQLPLMSVEWFLFWKCFWLELAQLHTPGCFCIKHQFPKYPGLCTPLKCVRCCCPSIGLQYGNQRELWSQMTWALLKVLPVGTSNLASVQACLHVQSFPEWMWEHWV